MMNDVRIAGPARPFDLRPLLAMRILFLVATLISAAFMSLNARTEEHQRIAFMYGPLSLGLAFSSASILWLRWGRKVGAAFSAMQVLLDITIITGVVYITGGLISPFLFLYLPLVMVVTLASSRAAGLLTAGVCAAAYAGLCFALRMHWIISADGSSVISEPQHGIGLQLIGLSSGLFLVTILTGILTKALTSSSRMVEASRQELEDLRRRQHSLIEGLSDGVVTIDAAGKVLTLNRAASGLLHIDESDGIGNPLAHLLKSSGAATPDNFLQNSGPWELSLPTGSGAYRFLSLSMRRLNAGEGNTNHLVVVRDVTDLRGVEQQLEAHEKMARLLADHPEASEISNGKFEDLIGESPVMRKVFSLIERVSQSEVTVLIGGESGTGKELAARAIHLRSSRRNKPFVAVNCGAIPESLIESELFGHKKGSFTGAIADSIGLFREANGGTIFLDEIGELPTHMQSKLLRVLQERLVRPVGGERDLPIDVRIIAATHRNLKREVEGERFREDLYYRLNVISISLPPLRDRKDDLPLLARAILSRTLGEERSPVISPAAMQLLMNYDYPGNVRELQNMLERAVVLGGAVILPEHLPESLGHQPVRSGVNSTVIIENNETSISFPLKLDSILESIERRYLEEALRQAKGVKKHAADLLGVNLRSFRYRCQKYDLEREDEETQTGGKNHELQAP